MVNPERLLWPVMLFGLSLLAVHLLIAAALASPLVRLFVDRPDHRKVHQIETPRMGGVFVVLVFMTLLYLWHLVRPEGVPLLPPPLFKSITFATLCILVIGLLDDTSSFVILSKAKLVLGLLIAGEISLLIGVRFHDVHAFGVHLSIAWIAVPASVLWIAGVTNAFNFVDGVDGLAGTVSLISFVTLGTLAGIAGDLAVVLLCMLCAGCTVGFLLLNVSPARVFLGDTGAMFMGILLGILSLYAVSLPYGRYSVIVAPLALGFPLLDLLSAMARRFLKAVISGKGPIRAAALMTAPDNDHIHHRLSYRGLGHGHVTSILALYHTAPCIVALIVPFGPHWLTLVLLAYLFCVCLWLLHTAGFTDRALKVLRNASHGGRRPGPSESRAVVGIVGATGAVENSLAQYPQQKMHFVFAPTCSDLGGAPQLGALLLYANPSMSADEERDVANRLRAEFGCPVIVASVRNRGSGGASPVGPKDDEVILVNKPLYIPHFLDGLSLLLEHGRWPGEGAAERARPSHQSG